MHEPQLFLGVSISGEVTIQISKLSEEKKALFLCPDSKNLQKIVSDGKEYLGKFTESTIDLETLYLLETNVRSLLEQLLPDLELKRDSILLIPFIEQPAHVPA